MLLLMLTFHITMAHISKLRHKQRCDASIVQTLNFLMLVKIFHLVIRSPGKFVTGFTYFLFFLTFTFLKSIGQEFCRTKTSFFLMFSHNIRIMDLREEYHREKVFFNCIIPMDTWHQHGIKDLFLLTLILGLRWYLPGLPTVEFGLYSSYNTL